MEELKIIESRDNRTLSAKLQQLPSEGKVVLEYSTHITRRLQLGTVYSWISGDSIRAVYSQRGIKARCANAGQEACWNATGTLLHRTFDIGYNVSKSLGSIKSWSLPRPRTWNRRKGVEGVRMQREFSGERSDFHILRFFVFCFFVFFLF